ncbi:esterase-like activity of phytase family protein [Rhizobium sp. CNPSo 3490]|uniref:esterase-like activity of phytase family protein n=1 Tax=Rhizobium sp. CNPSo 3490 TaxID=3021407 RepID=UPI00254F940A|nr:esterase-like activity of phytase family protein [Rhizobium sp. CNPSo 3490]MDK4735584.1 esterase-like activity of phytase family protein [Rhizobium sp. CNPSo 3490]
MMVKRLCRAASIPLCLAGGASAAMAGDEIPIISRQISDFRIGSSETTFGSLEFLGGLEMVSSRALFGSLSSIRFRQDQKHFIVVLDTGQWLTGSIERDARGRLSGLSAVEITPIKDRAGRSREGKAQMDAEGVALDGDRILVSFEQNHRVDVYPDPGFAEARATATLPILIPRKMLSDNRGIETIAVAPASSPLKSGVVIVSERGLDSEGNRMAAILSGPLKGLFSIKRDGSFDVTDGAFLPDGDLLLLERRFNMAEGIGMRLRRIKGANIRPQAVVDGELLLEGTFNSQIDNMEGLDVFQAADGTTHIIMVSDDNHSILQRNLMLEFRLSDSRMLSAASD